jgi:hypothetical protein
MLADGGGDFFFGRAVALHGSKDVALLLGQAAVVAHTIWQNILGENTFPCINFAWQENEAG